MEIKTTSLFDDIQFIQHQSYLKQFLNDDKQIDNDQVNNYIQKLNKISRFKTEMQVLVPFDFVDFVSTELRNDNFHAQAKYILQRNPIKIYHIINYHEFFFICNNIKSFFNVKNDAMRFILVKYSKLSSAFKLFQKLPCYTDLYMDHIQEEKYSLRKCLHNNELIIKDNMNDSSNIKLYAYIFIMSLSIIFLSVFMYITLIDQPNV